MSPSKGPGMSEFSAHYRQHMDACYMSQLLHEVNHLACRTFQNSVYFFKWAKMFGIPKGNHLGFCRMTIQTSNYCVSAYVNKSDKETRANMVSMLSTWMEILSRKVLHPIKHNKLENALKFMKQYGFGVHTACRYLCSNLSSQ